jgi:MFS family permease
LEGFIGVIAKLSRLLNVNLRWFLFAMILANIAGNMAYSMMSLYLVDLGASITQVGMVYTLASIVPILLQLLGGWISDTIGRLRAIAIGSAISVFGYILFFIAPSWQWVMIGLSIEYISSAFVGPSFAAYIAEQTEEANRGRVYGISRGLYMVVMVIGPGLGGMISQRLDFQWMMLVAFSFYAVATVVRIWMGLAVRFRPSREVRSLSIKRLVLDFKAILIILVSGGILTWIWITDAISDSTYNLIGDLLPIYMSRIGNLSVAEIGLLGSTWGVASIGGSFLGGWLTDKNNERTIIAGGFFLVSLALLVTILSRTISSFLLSRIIYGLGVGLLMPAWDSLISKVVEENKRGLAFGFFGTSLGILSLPMPWIGARMWDHFSPQTPFWIALAACVISIPITWLKFKLPDKTGEKITSEEPA